MALRGFNRDISTLQTVGWFHDNGYLKRSFQDVHGPNDW